MTGAQADVRDWLRRWDSAERDRSMLGGSDDMDAKLVCDGERGNKDETELRAEADGLGAPSV